MKVCEAYASVSHFYPKRMSKGSEKKKGGLRGHCLTHFIPGLGNTVFPFKKNVNQSMTLGQIPGSGAFRTSSSQGPSVAVTSKLDFQEFVSFYPSFQIWTVSLSLGSINMVYTGWIPKMTRGKNEKYTEV